VRFSSFTTVVVSLIYSEIGRVKVEMQHRPGYHLLECMLPMMRSPFSKGVLLGAPGNLLGLEAGVIDSSQHG
jgi:hypothetical protein